MAVEIKQLSRAVGGQNWLLKSPRGSTRPRVWRFAALAVVAQLVPQVITGSNLVTVDLGCAYAVAAIGLNVIFGWGGLISVGQGAVMAVGGYSVVLLFGHSTGLVWSILVACALGGLASFGMGLFAMRVKTHYFILASIAVAEVIVLFATNATGLTGGANGQAVLGSGTVLGQDLTSESGFFHVASIVVLIVAYLADSLRASRAGLGLAGLTMNQYVARASGVSPNASRSVATIVGGIFGGLGGAMIALLDGYIGPQDFDINTATLLLLIVVVAGRARSGGVVVGSLILTYLSEGLLTLQAVGQLVYGLALIVLLIYAPKGLSGAVSAVRDLVGAWTPRARRKEQT